MKKNFRKELIKNNRNFKEIFNTLYSNNEIYEFTNDFIELLNRDRTPIIIDHTPYAFKDLFHLDLTVGNCEKCSKHLVMLLDKFHIYSEAVKCINNNFIGTVGSSYGGHWYVVFNKNGENICIDTSLHIMGSIEAFKKLGHIDIKKLDIDTIFKENPELIDIYENMIINKTGL